MSSVLILHSRPVSASKELYFCVNYQTLAVYLREAGVVDRIKKRKNYVDRATVQAARLVVHHH